MVVYTTLQFAEWGCKASALLFPSLIYRLLKSQGFTKDSNEKLTVLGNAIKIVPALLKGHRKVDLPWIEPGTIPDIVPNVANIFDPADYLKFHPSFLVDQIQFSMDQIVLANERIQIANQQIFRDRATIAQFEDLVAKIGYCWKLVSILVIKGE